MEHTRNHDPSATRRHLRLAGSGEFGEAQATPTLSDLRVLDREAERSLSRAGFAVVLDLALPSAALHASVRSLIESSLEGRVPMMLQKRVGYLRVVFNVEDHGAETGAVVDRFGDELAALLSAEFLERQFFIARSEPSLTAL